MSMAGEMLGEKNQEKLFSIILKREENQTCADCPTKAPTWVSLDFGVFVCMNCSGAHRHLSRNFTRVYSTKIDSWNKSNFQIMDHVGNEIANSYWEFKKPTKRIAFNATPEERVRFVNDKYIRKMYANPKSQNPVLTFVQRREMGILERPYQNKERIVTPQVNCVGEKEFISNGPSNLEHENLRRELKINAEKKFNSVNYPKNSVDLLDIDEPSVATVVKTQPQHSSIFKPDVSQAPKPPLYQQQKQQPKEKEEDIFSNFVTAPQTSQTSMSTNLLDMYSKASDNNSQQAAKAQSIYPVPTQNCVNNSAPQLYQNQVPMNNNQYYQQQQQPKPYQGVQIQQQQYPSQQNMLQQQTQQQPKSVDLMSLYNQNTNNTQGTCPQVSNQNGTQYLAQQQQQQTHPVVVDKDRFQALNQMNSYGTAYYPYYAQNQQNMGFYQQNIPQAGGYQAQQWR